MPAPPLPPIGPELTQVAAEEEHTREWLIEQIRDPKKHKPDGKMPSFGKDTISDEDLNKLVDYLLSLK